MDQTGPTERVRVVDADILRMDQEDMVDEIMVLRGERDKLRVERDDARTRLDNALKAAVHRNAAAERFADEYVERK